MLTKSSLRMLIVGLITFAVVLLVLTMRGAGLSSNRNASEPPIADLSSPERALKSYWSLRQWLARHPQLEAPQGQASLTTAQVMSAVTAGETRDSFHARPGTRDPLEFSLLQIEQTSEREAVATARIRNRARDPAVVTPTPIELFETEGGSQLRYVLRKDDSGWRVTEVWRLQGETARERIR